MRRPQGYAVITSPDGVRECDTITCGHCQRIVHVGARKRVEDIGGLCKSCMRPICGPCVDKGNCDPFEKKLERAEARDIALRSYGF